jgi:hypothetical protein
MAWMDGADGGDVNGSVLGRRAYVRHRRGPILAEAPLQQGSER